ncbi:MAG: chromosome partitioning protein ParB [Saprospiraceae bacterium]|nr:MAG: chromosome partitioning protein ParB [Saprospiraceae bacterium]
MAKRIQKSNKVSKDQLASSIKKKFSNAGGSGIHAFIPQKLDEEYARDPEKVVKELSQHFAMLPISQVESNPDQPRREFTPEALQELSDSIKVHGLIQPITVRKFSNNEYQIISGERRWRASKMAGLEEIPAYIRVANDQTLLEMALIENIQREDLNPFEIAVAYYRLKEECAMTDKELAGRVGKQRSTVTNYLRLLDLHFDVVEGLKSGSLSMGHARAIAGLKDKLLQKKVLDEIQEKKLSVRDAEKLVKEYSTKKKNGTPKKSGKLPDGHQKILEDFRAFFGTKQVKIDLEDEATGKGHIMIPFSSSDELTEFFKCIEQ